MAKALVLVAALCFLALASSFAHAHEQSFTVFGLVYCDPCLVEFHTKLSKPISGAHVQLQCRHRDNSSVTVTEVGVTGEDGMYNVDVAGNHEDEICEVSALISPNECNVRFTNADKARVLLSENAGVKGTSRYANPLGFKTSLPNPKCKTTLFDLGMVV